VTPPPVDVDPAVQELVDAGCRVQETAPDLTERELDVLALVLAGASATQISRALEISPSTVKGHMRAIYAKTGLDGREAVIRRAFDLPVYTADDDDGGDGEDGPYTLSSPSLRLVV